MGQPDRVFGKPLNIHFYMHKIRSWLIIPGVVSAARNPSFVPILISPSYLKMLIIFIKRK